MPHSSDGRRRNSALKESAQPGPSTRPHDAPRNADLLATNNAIQQFLGHRRPWAMPWTMPHRPARAQSNSAAPENMSSNPIPLPRRLTNSIVEKPSSSTDKVVGLTSLNPIELSDDSQSQSQTQSQTEPQASRTEPPDAALLQSPAPSDDRPSPVAAQDDEHNVNTTQNLGQIEETAGAVTSEKQQQPIELKSCFADSKIIMELVQKLTVKTSHPLPATRQFWLIRAMETGDFEFLLFHQAICAALNSNQFKNSLASFLQTNVNELDLEFCIQLIEHNVNGTISDPLGPLDPNFNDTCARYPLESPQMLFSLGRLPDMYPELSPEACVKLKSADTNLKLLLSVLYTGRRAYTRMTNFAKQCNRAPTESDYKQYIFSKAQSSTLTRLLCLDAKKIQGSTQLVPWATSRTRDYNTILAMACGVCFALPSAISTPPSVPIPVPVLSQVTDRSTVVSTGGLPSPVVNDRVPLLLAASRELLSGSGPEPAAISKNTNEMLHLEKAIQERVSRLAQEKENEHYYSPVGILVRCMFVPNTRSYSAQEFEIPQNIFDNISRLHVNLQGRCTRTITNGSFMIRIRCVEQTKTSGDLCDDRVWYMREHMWPDTAFLTVNGRAVYLRRTNEYKMHYPCDISNEVQLGMNQLSIAVMHDFHAPTDHAKYKFCVELMESMSFGAVVQNVWHNRVQRQETHERMMTKLKPSADDDDIIVEKATIRLSLIDPVSLMIMEIPVRSKSCTHLECFDLVSYLKSRTRKTQSEPPNPDGYKCPICRCPARPKELVMDSLLAHMVELASRVNKMARAFLIDETGQWKFVTEDESPKDDKELRGQKRTASMALGGLSEETEQKPQRREFIERAVEREVIDLDCD